LLSASTVISNPVIIAEDNTFSGISTKGIFEIAHPDAVIISALLLHTTALGAAPFIFNEYIA
jgi:hypothetical protein